MESKYIREMTAVEKSLAAAAMIRFGGSFVTALGQLYQRADLCNQSIIERSWPELFERYFRDFC
jgi:hypothetical protein